MLLKYSQLIRLGLLDLVLAIMELSIQANTTMDWESDPANCSCSLNICVRSVASAGWPLIIYFCRKTNFLCPPWLGCVCELISTVFSLEITIQRCLVVVGGHTHFLNLLFSKLLPSHIQNMRVQHPCGGTTREREKTRNDNKPNEHAHTMNPDFWLQLI